MFSQVASLDKLEENIRDAYQLMMDEQSLAPISAAVKTKEIELRA